MVRAELRGRLGKRDGIDAGRTGEPHAKWYRQTMLATIDAGGRVVVPKDIRERLGFRPGAQVELTEVDGALEITPVVTPMRVIERDGGVVLDTNEPMPTLTAAQVRAVQEATRR